VSTPRELLGGLVFPESPRWHAGKLWFSDPFGGRVARLDGSAATTIAEFADDTPSGLGFLPDGTPLLALMKSRRLVRIEAGVALTHADVSELTGRINDMVVDPDGRAFVGCGVPGDAESGGLIVCERDGSARLAASGIPRPNGVVLTPGRETLLYAASDERVLMAFDLDGDGELSNLRRWAGLGGRMPDGICLDAEGAVWAGTLGDGYVRVREGGEIVETVATGGGRLDVACVLGGDDRRTLYMASAITTFEQLARGEGDTARGFILASEVDVPGAGWP
jgi:sugar lactone lactonase YvrE